MTKKELLQYIASAGYDVGFGAKKHFATFDIIEKGPGWLGFVSLVGGIYSLFVPILTLTHVSAAFVVFGVISLYVGMYGAEKQRYEEAGKALTEAFHELHLLYRMVKSLPDTTDFTSHIQQVRDLRSKVLSKSLSKQIFLSDWYAHIKFFWQNQIDWIEEERPFRFFRDKVPISAYVAAVLVVLAVVAGFAWSGCVVTAISSPPAAKSTTSAPSASTAQSAGGSR